MATAHPRLEICDLSYRQAGKTLLAPLSFTLQPAEFVWLTGPSGSGKSTLLRLLAALLTPSQGHIFFNGKDISTLPPEAYRQQVSYCFQTPRLFGATVYDNLMFPWQLRQQSPRAATLIAALESVRLAPDLLHKPIAGLSGGERQRVALLRNLQFPPAVLLLDEVTSALDAQSKASVGQLIRQTADRHGISILWVNHDTQACSDGARVLTLHPVTEAA